MAKQVYVETTIPSYLVAWPSRDLLHAARQQITHEWWNNHRKNYLLCISQIVLDEAACGDANAAERRLAILANLPLIDLTQEVDDVAAAIIASGLLPAQATRDAIHIGIPAVRGVAILLTWNCRHIANADIMRELGQVVANAGYHKFLLFQSSETTDTVIREVRRIKEALVRAKNFDVRQILNEAREKLKVKRRNHFAGAE